MNRADLPLVMLLFSIPNVTSRQTTFPPLTQFMIAVSNHYNGVYIHPSRNSFTTLYLIIYHSQTFLMNYKMLQANGVKQFFCKILTMSDFKFSNFN
jgi:hypothetical protein